MLAVFISSTYNILYADVQVFFNFNNNDQNSIVKNLNSKIQGFQNPILTQADGTTFLAIAFQKNILVKIANNSLI